jgi:hypothetical protein
VSGRGHGRGLTHARVEVMRGLTCGGRTGQKLGLFHRTAPVQRGRVRPKPATPSEPQLSAPFRHYRTPTMQQWTCPGAQKVSRPQTQPTVVGSHQRAGGKPLRPFPLGGTACLTAPPRSKLTAVLSGTREKVIRGCSVHINRSRRRLGQRSKGGLRLPSPLSLARDSPLSQGDSLI